jgi:hypothetical protein
VSFFDDDEPEEPTRSTRQTRPRRAAPAGARGGRPPGRATVTGDPEAIRRRRLVVAAVAVAMCILVVLLVNSCVNSQRTSALKDFNRDVTAITDSSDKQVSRQLFDVLSSGGQSNDVQVAVQQVRQIADDDVKRAKALDPPTDAVVPVKRDFELVLNLRAAGVRKIADLVPTALSDGSGAQDAISRIAGQMQAFLASDVVFSQRVGPLLAEGLAAGGVKGQTIPSSKFLPSIGWLDPGQVADRLNPGARSSSGSSGTSGAVAPGTHGHGLVSVSVNGTTLGPGTNRIPATASPTFTATIANQGENDEGPVSVTITVKGSGKPITVTKRITQTKAGTNAEVPIPLGRRPPTGAAQITATVKPVPGEKVTDNNTQRYVALFE